MPDPENVATPAASTAMPSQPDLSSMSQPGAQAAPQAIPESAPTPNLTQGNLPAYGEPGAAAEPSTVVPAGKPTPVNVGGHSKLLAMVQGLSDGLAGFSAGIASKGKVSGAEVVQNLEAERQQSKQSATAAAQAQKNAELQNQLTTGSINNMNIQNHILGQTWNDEVDKSHFATQEAGLGVQQKAQEIFDTTGRVPTGWNADPSTGQVTQGKPGAPSVPAAGAAPAAGTPAAPSMYDRRAGIILDAVGKELADANGNEDPNVTAARKIFADPNSTIEQKQQTLVSLQARAGMNQQVIKNLTDKADLAAKQQTVAAGSPVSKLSTPEALAEPGAQAAIQAKIDDPNTDVNDIPRLRALLPQAAVAQFNAETIKRREARNTQIINQGDPTVAGHLLADRSLTLDELKARQVTPEFITAAVTAAQKYDKTFKAPEATAQSRIAASPANSQFFGNTDSLLVKGGTLDQLATAYAALGNTQIPVINKLDNLRKASVGSGPLAAAYAAQLGVADDYSKVISGGSGSDTSRQQALDIISRNLSPEGQAAAIAQIRKTVTSQRNGRIGTNPYLADMYPDPSTRQESAGVSGTQPAAPAPKAVVINPVTKQPQTIGHTVGETIVQNGRNYIVTAVDGTGKVTGANPAGAR